MNRNTKENHLYFAYGSNLNKKQMSYRCPRAVALCAIELRGFELVFNGVADIIETHDKRNIVHGALWHVSDECLIALDRYEGAPHLYRREYVDTIHGEALTYVMNAGVRDRSNPSARYAMSILQGYDDFKIKRNASVAHKTMIEAARYAMA